MREGKTDYLYNGRKPPKLKKKHRSKNPRYSMKSTSDKSKAIHTEIHYSLAFEG